MIPVVRPFVTAMIDSVTPPASDNRFDAKLSIVFAGLGLFVGGAVLFTAFAALLLVPCAGIILGLVGASFARHRCYLVAFCSITTTSLVGLVLMALGSPADDRWLGLFMMAGIWWALPFGFVFYIIRMSRE